MTKQGFIFNPLSLADGGAGSAPICRMVETFAGYPDNPTCNSPRSGTPWYRGPRYFMHWYVTGGAGAADFKQVEKCTGGKHIKPIKTYAKSESKGSSAAAVKSGAAECQQFCAAEPKCTAILQDTADYNNPCYLWEGQSSCSGTTGKGRYHWYEKEAKVLIAVII